MSCNTDKNLVKKCQAFYVVEAMQVLKEAADEE
jgi:hypothetical protein